MATADRLAGIWLRLHRADEHLAMLDSERSAFLGDVASRVITRLDPQTGDYIMSLDYATAPPLDWGVPISEFAHHLRSALDNLVWALVELRGNRGTDYTAFVIADTSAVWKKHRGRLRDISHSDFLAIHDMQPYRRGNLAEATKHPLSRLGFLNNRDKHKVIHAGFVMDDPIPMSPLLPLPAQLPFLPVLLGEDQGEITQMTMRGGPFDGSDTDFLRITVANPGTNPQFRLQGKLPIDVSFSYPDRPLRFDDLTEIRGEVRGIVDGFAVQFT